MAIRVNDTTVDSDEEGFLLNPGDWDECVAQALAAEEGITLRPVHWAIISFFRTWYEDHQRHPTMNKWLRTVGKFHGKRFEDAVAYRDYLYPLFPKGPVRTLCKLAGRPKPTGVNEV